MLTNSPILHKQECEGNYNFNDNVKLVCTNNFMEAFAGEDVMSLILTSQKMIIENNKNPDYLQSFSYNGIEYWCISNFERGYKATDYLDTPQLYITFLLPQDY